MPQPGIDAGADGPPTAGGGTEPIVVDAFKAAHVYFKEMDNKRRAYSDVNFPATGSWKGVSLRIRLGCPNGKCDRIDRWGLIGIPKGEGMAETITEIARFATPYGRDAEWTTDVTALLPLLTGQKKLVVKIDTWVGPGSPYGDGWLVDATFTFTPGVPERVPTQVIPLWDVATFDFGDPAKPSSMFVPMRTVVIPSDATAVELRSFITGHGQGNLQNCAEFCAKTHGYRVSGMDFTSEVWRDDCATTAVSPQPIGRFPFAARAGWCPGATVRPWSIDVTAAVKKGADTTIEYGHEAFENTCRPDAPVCKGCVFTQTCAYDDGLHTTPNYLHSALLIVYGSR